MKFDVLFIGSLAMIPGCTVLAHRKLSNEIACHGGGYAEYEDGTLVGGDPCTPETYCCQGTEACTGFNGTICHGNVTHPNCDGNFSCGYANIGFVKGGSCVKNAACFTATIGVVEANSCTNFYSCGSTTASAIKNHSCVGPYACRFSILDRVEGESCIGEENACRLISNTALVIQNQSCWGVGSCEETKVEEFIQNGSCHGNYMCDDGVGALSVSEGKFRFRVAPKCDAEYCSCLVASMATSYHEVQKECPRFQKARLRTSFYYANPLNLTSFAPRDIMACFNNVEHRWLYLCEGGSSLSSSFGEYWSCNHFFTLGPKTDEVWAFYTTDGLNLPLPCSEMDLSFLLSLEPSAQPSNSPSFTPSLTPSSSRLLTVPPTSTELDRPSTQPSNLPSFAPTFTPSLSSLPTDTLSSAKSHRPSTQSSSAKASSVQSWKTLFLVALLFSFVF